MSILKRYLKITDLTIFVIVFIFFSTLQARSLDKYNKANNIAGYFSGILLLNESKYSESYKYLKSLDGLEKIHSTFSLKYLYSLINSGNFNEAYIFSKKLEKENKKSFESDLVIGIYYFKNSNFETSKKYFASAINRKSRSMLDSYMASTLFLWSNLNSERPEVSISNLDKLDDRFENLKRIQSVFLNCFYKNSNTEILFEDLLIDQKTDFSRYNYFYAKYLSSIGKIEKAKKIIKESLTKYPRNLLLNQYLVDLKNSKNSFNFSCENEKDVVAELMYIAANALSSQSIYPSSNFYLNLTKYLNKDFHAYDTLLAENMYKINDFKNSKKIYKKLTYHGDAISWYSNKQIARILIKEEKKIDALNILKDSYNKVTSKGIYETFDYAEFLKNNEEFEKSIVYYSQILNNIDSNHPLYPDVTDGRGVAYERIGEWDKAEKDLLASLEASPDQAYVINYLAYSWIEQGIKIEKSLEMLEKANKLRSNDPYIIDSLGWALFKLKRFKESKDYLQLAVKLMPADPIVNDHYGDVLWKNGKELQARYYWNYVLGLEEAEKDLKDLVQQKLIKGL